MATKRSTTKKLPKKILLERKQNRREITVRAGSVSTETKARASAENGKKGGRPEKPLESYPCTCGQCDSGQGKTNCPRGRRAYYRTYKLRQSS